MNLELSEEFPSAIFVPGGEEHFHIYRGSPDEMVSSMAREMGAESIQTAVGNILVALALHRRILIKLPTDLDDHDLSRLFVYALLDTKVARPVPLA